jgi:hypothetical protein
VAARQNYETIAVYSEDANVKNYVSSQTFANNVYKRNSMRNRDYILGESLLTSRTFYENAMA